MTLNLTRGGLVPAKLINLATNEEVKFMFNPFEYTISKSNSWNKETGKASNVPVTTFMQGGPQQLKLTLHFDTLAAGTDVREHTQNLWKMMMLEQSTENQHSGKGTPPAVAFEWGRLYFKAVITSMSEKFTLFTAEGLPVRCQVDISLEQHMDGSQPPPQLGNTTPRTAPPRMGLTALLATGVSAQVAMVAVAMASTRMDHIASQTTGDAGNMRQVAERNNVDNPLKIRNGQTFG